MYLLSSGKHANATESQVPTVTMARTTTLAAQSWDRRAHMALKQMRTAVQFMQWSFATLAFACGFSTVTRLLEISDQTTTLLLTPRHGVSPLPTSPAPIATLALTSRINQSLQTLTFAALGQIVSTRASSSVPESARTLSQPMPQLSRRLTGSLRASESTRRMSNLTRHCYADMIPSPYS